MAIYVNFTKSNFIVTILTDISLAVCISLQCFRIYSTNRYSTNTGPAGESERMQIFGKQYNGGQP